MVRSTEVIADARSAVVVKRGTGEAVAGLRAEADRLLAAAHPGVVQLLGSSGTEDRWELRLAHGGRTLEVVDPRPVAQVAGVVAAIAATLADLHDSGIVHGRVDRSHVLIGPHGRPVLCGFGSSASGATPADDVAALGALLAGLLGSGTDMEPIPDRRWWPRPSWSGWERRSLLLLADQACAEPATRRPTARRLAAALAEAVPGAVLAEPAPAPGSPPSEAAAADDPIEALRATATSSTAHHPARLPALACALAGVVILGVGALRVVRPVAGPVPQRSAPAAPEEPASAVAPSSTTATATSLDPRPTTTTTVPPAPCVPAAEATTAPGACEPIRVEGTTVLVGDRRYQVGQPGDRVVLGDWDCDGVATPAVLRPGTGEVFVFAAWAGDGDLVVGPVGRVPGATELAAQPGADGCADLVARRPDGTSVPAPAERAA